MARSLSALVLFLASSALPLGTAAQGVTLKFSHFLGPQSFFQRDVAEHQPCAGEDALELQLEDRRVGVHGAMHAVGLHQHRELFVGGHAVPMVNREEGGLIAMRMAGGALTLLPALRFD